MTLSNDESTFRAIFVWTLWFAAGPIFGTGFVHLVKGDTSTLYVGLFLDGLVWFGLVIALNDVLGLCGHFT